jgi:hypothetical protein
MADGEEVVTPRICLEGLKIQRKPQFGRSVTLPTLNQEKVHMLSKNNEKLLQKISQDS